MEKKKINSLILKIVLTVVLLGIVVGGILLFKKLNTTSVKDGSPEYEKLVNECKCIERNNLKCPEGFVLVENSRVCRDEAHNLVTNVLLGCSKYDCNGKIYEVEE